MNKNQIGNEIYAKHTIERDGIFYSGERRKEILEMEWWQQIHAAKNSFKVRDLLISIGIIGVLSFNGIAA